MQDTGAPESWAEQRIHALQMRLDAMLYLSRTAKVTPCAVVRSSVKAGLQPVPARLAPVDARPAVLREEAHLGLQ